jgi:nitric oxide reductase activation protein
MKSLGSGLKDIALKDIAVGAMAVGDTIATPVGGRRALVELTGRAQDEARKRGVARVEVEITQEADSTGRPFLVAEAYAFDLSI